MIKMVDTAVPMNEEGYPVARAKHIWLDDDTNLQKAIDDGLIGGSGGASNIQTITEEEYQNLTDQEKLEGDFHCYDTGNLYYKGVSYGRQTDISGKQDNLNQVKFTMRRNSASEGRYCLIGSSDLLKNLLMCEPYRFQGVFGDGTTSVENKSIIDFMVSFREGVENPDDVLSGFANSSKGFDFVDLLITADETTNTAYAYVDFKVSGAVATGEITKPVLEAESYMDFAESFELVDTYQGTLVCKMSDYCKVITEIKDEVSDFTVWSSQKTSDEIAEVETALPNIKKFASPSGTARYITISGTTLGDIEVHSAYAGKYMFTSTGAKPIFFGTSTYLGYTLTGWAWSSDKTKLYLRVSGQRDFVISAFGSDGVEISDMTTTAPTDVTFNTTFNYNAYIDNSTSENTSTYSSAKIDEKYGAYTFGTADTTQWLKLTLGNYSKFQPIVISDQYGGKVEITGMADDGTYKSVKLVRYSYGDWTTYSATDYTTTSQGDANYKIRRLYYYPTNGCYYLEVRQWCTIKVSGATTKPEMVTSLPAEASEMTSIPESKYASINNSATNSTSTWSSSKIASRLDLVQEVSMDLNYYDETWLADVPVRSVFCANANKNIPPITDYESYAMGTLTVYLTSRGYIQEYKTYVYENTWKIVTYTRAKIDTTITAWTLA